MEELPAIAEREEVAPAVRMRSEHEMGVLPVLQSLLYVLVLAIFCTAFTVQPIRIPSPSMEPTLLVGDFLLLDRQMASGDDDFLMPPAKVQRGEIVVFHDPVDDSSIHLVKRVIGLPGDRIRLRNHVVYVNGQPLAESYTQYLPSPPDAYRDDFPNLSMMDGRVDPAWWIRLRGLVHEGEMTVPAGDYFVLGDNRNESDDSRYWGLVPRKNIVGVPVIVYFSWNRTGEPNGTSLLQTIRDTGRWHRIFHIVQ